MRRMPSSVVHAKVSNRGQTSLPAELRHRWGIEAGGDVAFVDLGDAALILPGGTDQAKAELKAPPRPLPAAPEIAPAT